MAEKILDFFFADFFSVGTFFKVTSTQEPGNQEEAKKKKAKLLPGQSVAPFYVVTRDDFYPATEGVLKNGRAALLTFEVRQRGTQPTAPLINIPLAVWVCV